MKKIDIHCHVLPGLDDGAQRIEESIEMLKMAREQDICAVIATPHYSHCFHNSNPQKISELCHVLEQKAQQKVDPHFRVFPGQEILYSEDILEQLEQKKISTMAGSNYVLIEFHPSAPYSNIFRIAQNLLFNQYRPILAHVERYNVLRENDRMEELIDMGVYIQMNYHSIGGKWYDEKTRWCRKMLKEGKVHLLGTDMHNTETRCPDTIGADIWMDKHLESSYIKEISYRNPIKILKNEKI